MTARFVRTRATRRRNLAIESLENRQLFASFVVNTAADEVVANATTSLREAVALAEASSGDDDITFAALPFPADGDTTITLTAGPLAINAADGTLTIIGPGRDALTISGNDASRVFEIGASGSAAISALSIVGGLSTSQGGGIRSAGSLALDNVELSNNNVEGVDGGDGNDVSAGAAGGDALGGAIWTSGTLLIENSTLAGNGAVGGDGGAGLALGGGFGGYGLGGALYAAEGAVVTILDSTFDSNSANGGRGGAANGGTAGNGGAAQGGALFAADGVELLNIERTPFSGNLAFAGAGGDADLAHAGGAGGSASGGAITAEPDDVTIADSPFSANLTLGGAGGAGATPGQGGSARGGALSSTGVITISGEAFNNNTASGGASAGQAGFGFGGAIYTTFECTIDDVEFVSNGAYGGGQGIAGGAAGGAIYNDEDLNVTRSTFSFNIAQGGMISQSAGGVGLGGAIYSNSDLVLTDSTVASNTAAAGGSVSGLNGTNGVRAAGGGIYLNNGTGTTITGSTISTNTVTAGAGGAGSATIGGIGGDAEGGGIYAGGLLNIFNSTVYGNTATGGAGGSGAVSGGDGGNARGGGIHVDDIVNAVNVTIAANAANGGGAGAGGQTAVAGESFGGGVNDTSSNSDYTNAIIADNTADNGPDLVGEFVLVRSIVGSPATTFDTLPGSADNLLDTDPLLGALDDNGGPTKTALPQTGSPAINSGDNAAATAALGADATDQRGAGFPRFNGQVDIGAVETGGVALTVSGNGVDIADDDATPSPADATDFGAAAQGAPTVQRTFTVTNTGAATLSIFDLTVPDGYVIIEDLDATIAAGADDTFTLGLATNLGGTFAGDVVLTTNATDPEYAFAITGTVTTDGAVRINFQPAAAPVPAGYFADAGQVFGARGNGQSYGWNLPITGATRDRDINADQRLDSLVHMQQYGVRTWEIAVPNGTYEVTLAAGDAQYFNSVYKINVEGVLTINGTPNKNNRFFTATKTVVVTDGKLTVSNAAGAVNNKLNYIDIKKVAAVPPTKINFQPAAAPTAAGYLVDAGQVFGNRGGGRSYGWNQSAASFTRDRNVNSNQKFDTLVHTQMYGNRTWEMAVPNGTYSVLVTAGDPAFFNSVYRFNVEGVLTVNGTPTSGNRFVSGTKTVTVSDGRLTISNASGAQNNKLAFVEITPV